MPRAGETGPHCCGEYALGFKAAMDAAKARVDALLGEVRDAIPQEPHTPRQVMRMLRKLGDALNDKGEHKESHGGGHNSRQFYRNQRSATA